MISPFSLKIGYFSLDISTTTLLRTEGPSEGQIQLDISKSWSLIKEIVDKQIDAESERSTDPFRNDPKVKLMMFIFNALSNPEVEEKIFIDELLKTGKFSEEEARSYVKSAIIHGIIRDPRNGLYRNIKSNCDAIPI